MASIQSVDLKRFLLPIVMSFFKRVCGSSLFFCIPIKLLNFEIHYMKISKTKTIERRTTCTVSVCCNNNQLQLQSPAKSTSSLPVHRKAYSSHEKLRILRKRSSPLSYTYTPTHAGDGRTDSENASNAASKLRVD